MQGMQQPNSSVPAAITESRDVMIFLTPNWPQQCSPLSTVFDLIKVTDEEHHGLRGPIVAIDRFVDTYMSLLYSCQSNINKFRKRHHYFFLFQIWRNTGRIFLLFDDIMASIAL